MECPICLEPLINERTSKTKCNHIFHKECLKKIMHTNKCPICRTALYEKIFKQARRRRRSAAKNFSKSFYAKIKM